MNLNKILDRAKVGVMLDGSVFLSTITFSMVHRFNEEIKTAQTDGYSIEYNPDFFLKLTPDQRVALIAHEAWHTALMHQLRCGDRDHEYYNRAGDYVINQLLVDDGFTLPENGCQDNKYRGMSTAQVYDQIYQKDPPDDSNQDVVFSDGKTPPGQNNGNGNGNKDPKQAKADAQALESHIKGMLIKAKTQAQMSGKQAGNIPAEIARQLEELINPKLPWDQILNRFLTDRVKDDYTWARPNKRFMPDFYLPTQHSEALAKITIAIDTSGSISKTDLRNILSEIKYIKDTMKPRELEIIDCDHEIHNIWTVTEDMDLLELPFTGGGGTSCHPVLQHCEKTQPTALVYFTDLYLDKWTKEMDFPILWIVYNNPNATVPVGEITHYDINQER